MRCVVGNNKKKTNQTSVDQEERTFVAHTPRAIKKYKIPDRNY
jgi:hypothetical protein